MFSIANPNTLSLICDAESRVAPDADALTVPEVFATLGKFLWSEIWKSPAGAYTNRKPFIAIFRRNLQEDALGQLIDLALESSSGAWPPSARSQATLSLETLQVAMSKLLRDAQMGERGFALDEYSRGHIQESMRRIEKALDAVYSRNPGRGR
jgi:hypothetical protein